MGMFDTYEPVPAIPCPTCGTPLSGWQGKDGPCELLTWRQHEKQGLDDDTTSSYVLTDGDHRIYTGCGQCKTKLTEILALAKVYDNVWTKTVLVSSFGAPRYPDAIPIVGSCRWCESKTGCDCQERATCPKAGQDMHQCCGWCMEHDQPRFLCMPRCWYGWHGEAR